MLPVPKSSVSAIDLDLISNLKAIPDARMRRGDRIPAWYLVVEEVLGIVRRCQSPQDLERYSCREGCDLAIRHHAVLTEVLDLASCSSGPLTHHRRQHLPGLPLPAGHADLVPVGHPQRLGGHRLGRATAMKGAKLMLI